jgi:hypothetical protein
MGPFPTGHRGKIRTTENCSNFHDAKFTLAAKVKIKMEKTLRHYDGTGQEANEVTRVDADRNEVNRTW